MSDEQIKHKLEIVNSNGDDPYDLAKLRVSQDFLETTNVKKLITTVPVRKPGNQDFVRVHPLPAYRALMAFLELKDDRETYVVDLGAVPDLQHECFVANLFTAITRTGVLFVWPVRVPATDGRTNDWHTSAAAAAEQAMTKWVRIRANMSLRAYEIFLAGDPIPDPEWPDLPFSEIYRTAFKDRLINTSNHPVIRRLRGLEMRNA
jgi:hypothetical protein